MNAKRGNETGSSPNGRFGKKSPTSIGDLQILSCRGVLELFAFLVISTLFFEFRQVDLLAPLGETVRVILGCPPPPAFTTMALAGYTLSALVLIMYRTIHAARPQLRWIHIAYRSCFYFFYLASNTLETHFMPVLVAGLLLFTLEQLNIWTYAMKATGSGEPVAM